MLVVKFARCINIQVFDLEIDLEFYLTIEIGPYYNQFFLSQALQSHTISGGLITPNFL